MVQPNRIGISGSITWKNSRSRTEKFSGFSLKIPSFQKNLKISLGKNVILLHLTVYRYRQTRELAFYPFNSFSGDLKWDFWVCLRLVCLCTFATLVVKNSAGTAANGSHPTATEIMSAAVDGGGDKGPPAPVWNAPSGRRYFISIDGILVSRRAAWYFKPHRGYFFHKITKSQTEKTAKFSKIIPDELKKNDIFHPLARAKNVIFFWCIRD